MKNIITSIIKLIKFMQFITKGHNRHVPKIGGCAPVFWEGSLVPI